MSCERTKTNIPLLLAGELFPDERKEMLRHLEVCPHCRQEIEEMERTWNLMDRWKTEDPSPALKGRVMATVREELESVHVPWWSTLGRSLIFQTVVGALAFSTIIYLIFPYDRMINLCETNILKGSFLAYFPKGLVYFVLGLLYGLIPMCVSGICFSRPFDGSPLIKGLGAGSIFAAFLVPFFFVQCPQFASGMVFIMTLGMVAGCVTGGTGTLWVLSKVRVEVW